MDETETILKPETKTERRLMTMLLTREHSLAVRSWQIALAAFLLTRIRTPLGAVLLGEYPIATPARGELKQIEPMDYWYLVHIFRGPLTGVTIGYHPRCSTA